MKFAKRLLASILCLSMLMSCALIQAEENTEIPVYGEHTLGLINALEIGEYTTENLTEKITRGEFYQLLARANGYPGIEDKQTLFSDLKPGDDYESYVKTLYKIGLVTPTKDGRIRANESISATEAVALTVKALGYTPRAEALGGYPGGYLSVASIIDVSDGIDLSGNELTKGLALEIIYNALEADIMIEVPSVGSSAKEYRVERGTNLINTVHGLEIVEGVVDGVDISRVSGENDVLPFHMEIAGKELNCEDVVEPFGYLGYHVKAYHKFVRTYGDKIIYIEVTDNNKEMVFDIEDIKGIADSKMDAYEIASDKVKSYRLKKAIPVVYNGVSTNVPFTYDMISGKNGTVKLLDNTGDKTYDVAFVEAYDNFVVSYSNKGEKLVYDKYDNTKKLVLDNEIDEPYVIIFDETGAEIQPSVISVGDILSVYYSADDAYQTYIRVYHSNKVVSGEIEEITDENEIVVDGTVYELTDACLKNNKNLINVGALLKLSLDIHGYVAEAEALASTDMQYGFLVAADVESGLGGSAKMMFYIGEEELLTAKVAKNVRIDGIRYANTDANMFLPLRAAAKQMFPNSTEDTRSSVVRYSLNAMGEVSAVDTIMYNLDTLAVRESNHTAKNSLFAVKTKDNDMYRKVGSNHIVIGQNIPVGNDTMVMAYPDVETDKDIAFNSDEYDYLKITSAMSHGDYINAWAFYTRENQIVSDFLAVPRADKTSVTIPSANKFAIVDKIGSMLDEKYGTQIDCITFETANGKTRVPVKSGFSFDGKSLDITDTEYTNVSTLPINALKKGDVVRYKLDANGYLKNVVLYYRPETNQVVESTGFNGNVSSDFTWIAGYVYKCYPEGFYLYMPSRNEKGNFVLGKSVLEDVTVNDCTFVYHSAYNHNGYKVDLTEEMDEHVVSSFNTNNIRSFTETGYDCSFVLVQRHSGAPYVIVEVEGLE